MSNEFIWGRYWSISQLSLPILLYPCRLPLCSWWFSWRILTTFMPWVFGRFLTLCFSWTSSGDVCGLRVKWVLVMGCWIIHCRRCFIRCRSRLRPGSVAHRCGRLIIVGLMLLAWWSFAWKVISDPWSSTLLTLPLKEPFIALIALIFPLWCVFIRFAVAFLSIFFICRPFPLPYLTFFTVLISFVALNFRDTFREGAFLKFRNPSFGAGKDINHWLWDEHSWLQRGTYFIRNLRV